MAAVVASIKEKAVTGLRSDPKLWISTGASRFETAWQNREIHWSALLGRLQDPTITQETQAEYLAMPKAQQDKIKDTGGFVGGILRDGKRKSDTVTLRSMISFDLDTAPSDFVERMLLEMPVAWVIYSTHKHRPDKARLRMLIPLARDVSAEEYEAIGRKLAEEIGIQYFDATTFQPSRLMYWPSCSRDGEYVFEYHDDDLLDPDEWLGKYADWRDTSQWPTCPDEVKVQKKRADRAQDPTQKKGLVGVFCRAYTVQEAIAEYLPDVYRETERADRYTYTAGSTFGGLVIYDDGLFCYSNHSTDPAHGQDLNAFDLVRIHKFGREDEDVLEATPVTKRPSYKKMLELVDADVRCRRLIRAERQQEIANVFEGELDTSEDPEAWKDDLHMVKGSIIPDVFNLQMILSHDEELRGIRWNEFTQSITIEGAVPWAGASEVWKNSDDAGLHVYLSLNYADFRDKDVKAVLTQVALTRAYHPVKDYLRGLPAWDGVQRAESIFIKYLGADDDIYVKGVTRKWLLGAVTRIFRPGVKFDWCLTLTGDQGIGKSTTAAKLAGNWFSDNLSFDDMRDEKASGEKILGEWILEIGELKGLRKVDIESVKAFISRTVDKFRPAYAPRVEQYPRQCVLIGTGNSIDFLKDITGNRRFWPVHCKRMRGEDGPNAWDITEDEIRQIWAEALSWYDAGETLELSAEVKTLAEISQEEATEKDDRAGLVEAYLGVLLPENWYTLDLSARRLWLDDPESIGTVKRTEVSVIEIWAECFRKAPADKKRSDSDDITRMLRQLGWTYDGTRKRSQIYGQQGVYRCEYPSEEGDSVIHTGV